MSENGKVQITDTVMAKIRQYQHTKDVAQELYQAYVVGVGDALEVDFNKKMFDGNDFVDKPTPPEKKA